MKRHVCHLIDGNVDTAFFRAIVADHDPARFKVSIGSLMPVGALQHAMRDAGAATFALDAKRRASYPRALAKLVRLIRRARVDILHAHCFDPTFVGLIAARLARVRFVFTRHHSDHHVRLGKAWHVRIDAWCGRRADRVIAVSEATKQVMTQVEGVQASQVVVVFNGIAVPAPPSAEAVEAVRQDLELGDRPVCLMVARMHEEKGHVVLFDAIAQIRSRYPGLVVLLAGDGPHRAAIADQARQRGLDGVVRFLGRREDVPELMMLASVVTLPSFAESFGFAALEAMSFGRPVVVSTTGGLPEVVTNGETGLTVAVGDAAALAKAMVCILDNPEWAASLGHAGRRRASQFTSARMLRGYEAVYDAVLGGTRDS